MKKPFPLVAALILSLAGGALLVSCKPGSVASRKADETQEQLAAHEKAEAKKSQELTAQIEVLKSESAQLREKLAEAKSQKATGAGQRPNAAVPEGAAESNPDANNGESAGGGFMKGVAKMFTDPEMKKVMRGQQAMVVKMMYGDLGRELGLSAEETDQVMELLTDRQMEQASTGIKAMEGGAMDQTKIDEMTKAGKLSKAEYDRQLENILGKDRFAKVGEYEKSMTDRMALSQLQQQFSMSGSPLATQQTQSLLSIMKDERSKMPPTAFDPTNKDPGAQVKALQSDEGLNTYVAGQQDFNRRVLERARTVLNPDQVKALEASQKQQLEMQLMGLKMSKQMFKGGGKKGP